MTLKEGLADWTDWDIAAYRLANALGLISEDVPFATKSKHVFWTNNSIGNGLAEILDQFVALGVIERREEPDWQYRWNSGFRGTWER